MFVELNKTRLNQFHSLCKLFMWLYLATKNYEWAKANRILLPSLYSKQHPVHHQDSGDQLLSTRQ